MEKPLFTSEAGVVHTWEDDGQGGGIVHSRQDVGGILDHNGRAFNHNDGYSPSREMRRVGSIPMSILYLWKSVEGWDPLKPENADRLARKLNCSDWNRLRTAPGRLGVSNGGSTFR